MTSMGMMDCKKALEEAQGDMEKAIELLRKKGAAVAAKRGDNLTSQGVVHAYIHPGATVGVLVEINCETDFVARNEEVKKFAQDVCMHIAAMKPLYLSPAEVDTTWLEKEKNFLNEQLIAEGKKPEFIEKILEGKIQKALSEVCLLQQKFVKSDKHTTEQVLQDLIGKMGESIKIRRFARFEIGA
jgi:elongation factor Ts